MSFTTIERTSAPLYRSKLFLPGSQIKFFEKAAKGPADVVCLDLEDAVAPNDKEQARKNVVQFGSNGDAGVKMECRAFPIEPGFKYVCTLDIKCPAPGLGSRIQ